MKDGNCLNRRAFFNSLATASLTGTVVLASNSPANADETIQDASQNVVASFPLLQNVSNTSASIVWALNAPATGWVEWGTTPNLGKVARNSEFGLNPYEDEFISARIVGLAPNTKYYYRMVTCSFTYKTAYDKTASDPIYSDIYSFETTGPKTEKVTFAVMNDTHNTIPTIQAHLKRFSELKPDFIFWNGDVCGDYMSAEVAKRNIANPSDQPYAAERPLVFVPGNHDKRGKWVRNLKKCFTPWLQDDAKYDELGYNYAFRKGPIAFILLDTGEDKPDWHPAWSQMANYQPYRELQASWLNHVLTRSDIQSAPYIVAFCHIPLYDADPKANPGNILDSWASYHWSAAQMWGPLFEKHGVQLLVSAHQHRFSYAKPTANRSWAQIVGGGPEMNNAYTIRGEATNSEFKLTCEKLADMSVVGAWSYKPRF